MGGEVAPRWWEEFLPGFGRAGDVPRSFPILPEYIGWILGAHAMIESTPVGCPLPRRPDATPGGPRWTQDA